MSKGEIFWNWFYHKSQTYSEINTLKDENIINELLDDLLDHLHSFSRGLFFQIGGDETINELIITAEGNKKYFADVEQLVNIAPIIDKWQIIAFKPAQGRDFITKYKGIVLNPKEIWFLPLDNEKNAEQFGFRFYIPNIYQEVRDKYMNGIYQVLDTILGEKACALDIHYVDIENLPNDPEKEGLIELVELPEYINWRKSKML